MQVLIDMMQKNGLNNLKTNKMKTELEEAAKGYSGRHQDVSENLGKYLVSAVFQDGAKWQAERMYSEEEVKDLFNQYKEEFSIYRNMQILNAQVEEWFNQNKKK
jgi:hypothetical protein